MVERLTVTIRVAGRIPVQNKYLYGPEIVVTGLDVSAC